MRGWLPKRDLDDKITRVLLVEDSPGDARLIQEMLMEESAGGYVIEVAQSLQDVCRALASDCNDPAAVILLDLGLPDQSGLETLKRIVPMAEETPVVVITGLQDEEIATAAVREGAQDYLYKEQLDGKLLRRVIRYAIERHTLRIQLRRQSLFDELTGLHNRRGFLFLAEQQIRVAERGGLPSSLLFIDVDGLKQVNDTFGHEKGDLALVEMAALLRSTFRRSDILARLGGDEFAVLVAAMPSAVSVMREHLEKKLRELNSRPDRIYKLSFSAGVASFDPVHHKDAVDLLRIADAQMYEDKRHKRDNAAIMLTDGTQKSVVGFDGRRQRSWRGRTNP